MSFNWSDAAFFWPEAIMALTFVACLLTDLLTRERRHGATLSVLILGAVVALAVAVANPPRGAHDIMGTMMVVDPYAQFFRVLFLAVTLIVAVFSFSSREIMGADRENKGEYYAYLAVLCFGMMVMAEANNLVMLVLSIELVSITSYILAGYARMSLRSSEASLKYVLWGAVSSGLMLYGASILYGLSGAMSFTGLHDRLVFGGNELATLTACVLILAGIGYKISAVPFHFWTPDVYEGAPTPVAAIFAAGPKAAGFALLIRFFYTALVQSDGAGTMAALSSIQWPWLLAFLSVITMTWGNLAAIRQRNVKRLLAYSSIAHVGYLLIGFVLLSEAGLSAILFYLIAYAIMNLGAFLVVIALNNRLGSEDIDEYRGIGFREPLLAVIMVVFLLSLAGIPPTFGFIAKFYLFAAAIDGQMGWLAFIAVLNSVISLYYYMRIAKAMFFEHSEDEGGLGLSPVHMVLLVVLAVPTLVLGLYWSPVKAFADASMHWLLGG
ncbi:MAG TPA: NADH-quinone oxidoreductase subunit N [Candidatus Krumholzibacteria bacterium]|nr:NADH-quinone oxidoreductase subunit N [Candidatus Krumholzibacteria bacterium]